MNVTISQSYCFNFENEVKPMTRVVFYKNKGCKGDSFIIYSNHSESNCENCANLCDIRGKAGWDVGSSGSVLVEGDMEVKTLHNIQLHLYVQLYQILSQ